MDPIGDWPLTAQQHWHLAGERAGRPRLPNVWVVVRAPGSMTPERTQEAIRQVASHHTVLRSAIRGDRLVAGTSDVPAVTVRPVPHAAVADVLTAHRTTTFDRAQGLWDVELVVLDSGDRLLSLAFDGLIADGIAAGVVLHDLVTGPPARRASRPDYGDFARWQAERCHDCTSAEAVFWRSALAGVPVNRPIGLPFCLDARADPGGKVETRSLDVDPAVACAVPRVAAAAGTTAFVVLLAALFRWLAESTGERDLAVRVRVHGRPPEHARTVGLFADDVVLRVPHVPDDLRDVVADLRARWVEVARHQLFPYERLVACVEPDRYVRTHRPVEITVNAPSLPRASGGLLGGASAHEPIGVADVPGLAITLAAAADTMRVSVTYDVVRFASDDVEESLARLGAILRTGIA